jgi:hypothetical protein
MLPAMTGRRKGQQEASEKRRMGIRAVQVRSIEQVHGRSQRFSECGYACHTAVKAKDYIFHRTRSVEPARARDAASGLVRARVLTRPHRVRGATIEEQQRSL